MVRGSIQCRERLRRASMQAAKRAERYMNTRKRSVGSSIDDFLKEEGIYEECVNMAVKAIIAEQMVSVMEEKRITKTELAKKMHTSRASIQRLLDPESDAVTLESLKRAANLMGKKIKLELV
jgi:predicted XRE-type DNA-binding protein